MTGFYLNITHKSQQRDEKTLEQAVNSIITKEHLDDFLSVLHNMSDTTILNCINQIGAFKLSKEIDTKSTKIYFYHGTALNEMLARKSAKYISKHYPDAVVKCFKGKAHCENLLFYPEIMKKKLDDVLL